MTEPRAAAATARYECKVCWHVYDPAQGDLTWQVAEGTPFAALPPYWACPICSTPKADFLLLADDE